jgi:hypothetical protein
MMTIDGLPIGRGQPPSDRQVNPYRRQRELFRLWWRWEMVMWTAGWWPHSYYQL